MTQITYYAYTKYDLALMFTLLTLIDNRLAELQAMGLAALVQKANTLTAEIQQMMQQRQTEGPPTSWAG